MKRFLLAAAAAATLFTATAANASRVHWSINVDLPPVGAVVSSGYGYGYHEPRRVYRSYGHPVHQPAPVYSPYYGRYHYAPAPVYVAPRPHWRPHHRHHHRHHGYHHGRHHDRGWVNHYR